MSVKARISAGYMWRLGLVAVVCLLYAGWCAYDGFVNYPRINEVADAFESFQQEHGEQWPDKWPAYAVEQGYPDSPETRKKPFSMIAQYIQLGITLPIGLLFGYFFLSSRGRWIACDEAGLSSNGGVQVPFGAIKTLNKTRWERKGIAVAHYDGDGGIENRLVIDDWKFERGPTDQILLDLEGHLDAEQIVGDISEKAKADQAEQAD